MGARDENEGLNPQVEAITETEGLVVGLYHHLWLKNHKGETCQVNIPQTVIYRDSEPIAWYFTSTKEGKVMRKKKSKMLGPLLAEAFTASRDPALDVAAWFSGNMTHMSASPRKSRKRAPDPWMLGEEDERLVQELGMEYLAMERVQDLLDPGQYKVVNEELYDGVLQKFVEPRDANDFIIRALWSPTACVFERITNRNRLSDQRISLPDRIASFSGSVWLNNHCPLSGGVLCQRAEAQCDAVVAHLKDVSQGRLVVARMELYFKVDVWNRIWLLYCNSLKLEKVKAPRRPKIGASATPTSFALRDPTAPAEEEEVVEDTAEFMCVMTGDTFPGTQKIEVTYKLLMQHWFMHASQLVNESDRIHAIDNVPPTIRRANPNITREYYLKHRAQPFFLLKTANVSPQAAAELSAAALEDLAKTISRPNSAAFSGLATSASRPTTSQEKQREQPVRLSLRSTPHGGSMQQQQQQQQTGPALSKHASSRPGSGRPGSSGMAAAAAPTHQLPVALIPKPSTPPPLTSRPTSRGSSRPASRPTSAAIPLPPAPPKATRPPQIALPSPTTSSTMTTPKDSSKPLISEPNAAAAAAAAAAGAGVAPLTSRTSAPAGSTAPAGPGAATASPDVASASPEPGSSHPGTAAEPLHTIAEEGTSHSSVPAGPATAATDGATAKQRRASARDLSSAPVSSLYSVHSLPVAHKLQESGELFLSGGSLGSTMNSTASSRRSRQSYLLSNDDLKTLNELRQACTEAEQHTQQLLAQAQEVLKTSPTRRSMEELKITSAATSAHASTSSIAAATAQPAADATAPLEANTQPEQATTTTTPTTAAIGVPTLHSPCKPLSRPATGNPATLTPRSVGSPASSSTAGPSSGSTPPLTRCRRSSGSPARVPSPLGPRPATQPKMYNMYANSSSNSPRQRGQGAAAAAPAAATATAAAAAAAPAAAPGLEAVVAVTVEGGSGLGAGINSTQGVAALTPDEAEFLSEALIET